MRAVLGGERKEAGTRSAEAQTEDLPPARPAGHLCSLGASLGDSRLCLLLAGWESGLGLALTHLQARPFGPKPCLTVDMTGSSVTDYWLWALSSYDEDILCPHSQVSGHSLEPDQQPKSRGH